MRDYTKLDIYNAALIEVSADPITATNQAVPRADLLNIAWPFVLDELLREMEPHWAMARVELVASTAPDFGWSSAYTLPTQYVTVTSLNELVQEQDSDIWTLEGGELLCDQDEAFITYIERPEGDSEEDALLSRADPDGIRALILLLASRIAPRVIKDGSRRKAQLLDEYNRILSAAKTRAANERRKLIRDQAQNSRIDASRRYSTNG